MHTRQAPLSCDQHRPITHTCTSARMCMHPSVHAHHDHALMAFDQHRSDSAHAFRDACLLVRRQRPKNLRPPFLACRKRRACHLPAIFMCMRVTSLQRHLPATSPPCNVTSLQRHLPATSPPCNVTSLQRVRTMRMDTRERGLRAGQQLILCSTPCL